MDMDSDDFEDVNSDDDDDSDDESEEMMPKKTKAPKMMS